MRSGWKAVDGRGDELRFDHTSGAYVRIGGDDTITDEEMDQRIEDAMIAAEGDRPKRAEAPAGEMKGE